VKWILILGVLAVASAGAVVLRVPFDLRLKLGSRAARAELMVGALPLLRVWLIRSGPRIRIRWRVLGGRRMVLRPLVAVGSVARRWVRRPARGRVRVWARRAVRGSVQRLVRQVRIGRAALHIRYGTGRPELTGYWCAGFWTLAPVWYVLSPLVRVGFEPDFRVRTCRASASAKFSVPLYCLPLMGLWLVAQGGDAVRRAAAGMRRPRVDSALSEGDRDAAR
jgi:hypothetical protein